MSTLTALADAAAMGAAVSREGARLAFDRILSRAGIGAAPRSASEVGPGLLSDALQTAHPGARVAAVRALDSHSGTTDRLRVELDYDSPGTGPAPPRTVFVKSTPPHPGSRLFVNLMNLASTEVRFYDEIAADVPVPLPGVYAARCWPASGAFLLVLEDLARAGATFSDVSYRSDVDTARRVIRTFARLHAAFQDSPRFSTDLAWLRRPGVRPGLRIERFLCRASVGRGVERFRDVVPDQIATAVPRLIASRNALERAWTRGPQTLLHGDSHIGNMYFQGDSVGLLDWQVAQRGQGMRDVSYFLVNSVPTVTRREHGRELVELYLSTLDEHGVRPPSADVAWEQHRLHAVYTWIGSAVTASVTNLQPEPIARAGLTRACRALVDLDSLAALSAIGA